jgi:hypothetical protein
VERVIPNSETGDDASASQELSIDSLSLVQQGRTAATKGLLHDFSNVMVGLCSLSENALEETEPGTPLRDDMEIIRDSSVRAHHLLRRISTLNAAETQSPCLFDLGQWLAGEAETIRAVLPRGSEVVFPDKARSVLVTASESLLRDFILTLVAGVAQAHPRGRISMRATLSEKDDACVLAIAFSEAGTERVKSCAKCAPPCEVLKELAARMNAECDCAAEEGRLRVSLAIRGA